MCVCLGGAWGGWREQLVCVCVCVYPVLYGSWQFSGNVTQGQTAKNRGVVHDSCESRGMGVVGVAGGGVCTCVCGWGQRKRVLSH